MPHTRSLPDVQWHIFQKACHHEQARNQPLEDIDGDAVAESVPQFSAGQASTLHHVEQSWLDALDSQEP